MGKTRALYERLLMDEKFMKRSSKSVVIGEIRFKTIMVYSYTY